MRFGIFTRRLGAFDLRKNGASGSQAAAEAGQGSGTERPGAGSWSVVVGGGGCGVLHDGDDDGPLEGRAPNQQRDGIGLGFAGGGAQIRALI